MLGFNQKMINCIRKKKNLKVQCKITQRFIFFTDENGLIFCVSYLLTLPHSSVVYGLSLDWLHTMAV